MGCVLGQQDATEKKMQAIYYLNKKFANYEKRYPTLEQTCCALVWAAKRMRQYMLANTTWLISKTDPIKADSTLANDFVRVQHRIHKSESHKRVRPGGTLGSSPYIRLSTPLHEFPNEHIMTIAETEPESDEWKMWFDGASNLLRNGIGAILAPPKEYEACAMGIMMALEHQVKELKVFGNLALVIYQLRGEWETRDAKLIPYHKHVKEMSEYFDKITFQYIP
ncbi:hypothetical protein CR513_03798, partial [Mucuna pruriens]